MPAAYLATLSGVPPKAVRLSGAESVIAGRSPDCGLVLQNVEISRQHCRFDWNGHTCAVEDLGSARGTRVNGAAITARTELQPGDHITAGPATVQFGLGEPPEFAPAKAAAAPEARMLVHGAPADRIVPAADRELVIGRDESADVVLHDPGVSRRHASVRAMENGGCCVSDLHSTGGSFVNGRRFDTQELTVGDRLQVGPFCFQFDGQALLHIDASRGGAIRARAATQRAQTQTILDAITLHIPPAQFTGIIGPSGAGKSTLLNTLAGLDAPEAGAVLVDGEDIYATRGVHSFGFVPQEDIVHPELSVAQALRFSARLRLSAATPAVEIQKLILQTMDQLGLRARSAHPIHQLSGGQRKRVSVGAELLARPAILFLDEPSSGLDPATEFQLMELLRDLADTGCTIVCTTHVMENAYLMDQLVVLHGGCLVFGGTAAEAREYFAVGKLTGLYDRLTERAPKEWQRDYAQRLGGGLEKRDDATGSASRDASAAPRARRVWAVPILLARQWAILASDWRNFLILLGQPVVIAALVSWVTDDQSLAMFFAYVGTLWFGCSNAAQEIVKELPIYRRERLVGVSTHAYLASKFLFLTAVTAAQALLLYTCLLAGERGTDGAIGWQVAGLLGTALAAVGIGSAISAMARSVMQAVLVVPLILIPQILFSGFTVPANEMRPSVFGVSQPMPTFAAQRVMDTSFLWRKKIARDTLSDHWTSFRNLNRDGSMKTGEVFAQSRPGLLALLTHLGWGVVTYASAWLTLRTRERK